MYSVDKLLPIFTAHLPDHTACMHLSNVETFSLLPQTIFVLTLSMMDSAVEHVGVLPQNVKHFTV